QGAADFHVVHGADIGQLPQRGQGRRYGRRSLLVVLVAALLFVVLVRLLGLASVGQRGHPQVGPALLKDDRLVLGEEEVDAFELVAGDERRDDIREAGFRAPAVIGEMERRVSLQRASAFARSATVLQWIGLANCDCGVRPNDNRLVLTAWTDGLPIRRRS